MTLSKIVEGGKRITAGLLFVGVGAAPYIVPAVSPEYAPFVPAAQGVASAIGAALVGASKWRSWQTEKSIQHNELIARLND